MNDSLQKNRLTKDQIQQDQFKELERYYEAQSNLSFEFVAKDSALQRIKQEIEDVKQKKNNFMKARRLIWLSKKARRLSLLNGDFFRAQQIFLEVRDAYQEIFEKKNVWYKK